MRWLGLAIVLGSFAAASPVLAEDRAYCLTEVEESFRKQHIANAEGEIGPICDRFVAAVREGLPHFKKGEWLTHAIRDIAFGFAPKGARHAGSARYRFPFVLWMPRMMGQGPGVGSHQNPENFYAYDFMMPTGTPVLAAREGLVAAVRDGSTVTTTDPQGDRGNSVKILHDDGTFATYAHLQLGIPIEEGRRVRKGQRIGLSGNTGYSRAPHLHFVVGKRDLDGTIRAVPIRFGRPGSNPPDLQLFRHYGNVPRSKATIHVSVDGVRAAENRPVRVRKGDRVRLTVEHVDRDGTVTDVTSDPRVRFENMILWSVDASQGNVLRIVPDPGVNAELFLPTIPDLNQREGLVFVYHGVPRDPDFALFQLKFEIAL